MSQAPGPSPVFAFVKEQLQANPQTTFAEVAAKAAERGMHVPPIVYGRVKALLGLLPPKERAETAEVQAQPEATDSTLSSPQLCADLSDDVVDYFRAVVETRPPSTAEPAARRPQTRPRPRPKPDVAPVAASPIDQIDAIVRSLQDQIKAQERELHHLKSTIARVLHVLDDGLAGRT